MKLRSVRASLLIAALASPLSGCGIKAVPLHSNPLSPDSSGVPVKYFSVDWWERLVHPKLLEYEPREVASPAFDEETGSVLTLTRDGRIRSLGPRGELLWSVEAGSPFNAGALIHEGTAYVGAANGRLYALDARTGAVKWTYETGEELATQPVLAGDLLLVASEGSTVFAVNAKTGKWAWQFRRDPPAGFAIRGASRPTVDFGVAYVGFADGTVAALDASDGTVNWARNLSGGGREFLDVDTSPVLDDSGRVYVASYTGGLFALDVETGEVRWNTVARGLTNLIRQGEVLFASGDERVSAYLATTGQELWSLALPSQYGGRPLFAQGLLLVPTHQALTFVDPSTGRSRLAWDPGQGVSAPPTRVGNQLYVLSNSGVVYSLRLAGRGG